jgi:polysaccharide pyruvyl transferase WcaK-like protein
VITRRTFLQTTAAAALTTTLRAENKKPIRILLRSSWQAENIGDIAHTPGMLALFEKHRHDAEITLWPNELNLGVEEMLRGRFPKLRIALKKSEQEAALAECDFFLHGSGPGLVGWEETERARQAGKPYGFGGITLNDEELASKRALLAGAKFVFCRDSDSLAALKKTGITGPRMEFGPDATFALDLRDEAAADALMMQHGLERGKFLCAVPRLRWTPYWEIRSFVKPNPQRIAVNEEFAEKDHAKAREAITAWVRTTKMRVLIAPEMTYAVSRLRALLFDGLPDDVKPHVAVMDRYWLTAEAGSVYARAAAIMSFEQHSPIMAIAAGTPAVLLRQPTDTRKGRMWYDIGLTDWVFEIDQTTGAQIAERIVQIGRDLPTARVLASKARTYTHERMAAMMAAVG